MKKSQQKAKPVRAWAHVDIKTNKITWVCEPGTTKTVAKLMCMTGERLTRVEVKEV